MGPKTSVMKLSKLHKEGPYVINVLIIMFVYLSCRRSMCVVVSWQMCAWTLLCVMVTQQEWTYCGLAPPWSLTPVRGLHFLNSDFFNY